MSHHTAYLQIVGRNM